MDLEDRVSRVGIDANALQTAPVGKASEFLRATEGLGTLLGLAISITVLEEAVYTNRSRAQDALGAVWRRFEKIVHGVHGVNGGVAMAIVALPRALAIIEQFHGYDTGDYLIGHRRLLEFTDSAEDRTWRAALEAIRPRLARAFPWTIPFFAISDKGAESCVDPLEEAEIESLLDAARHQSLAIRTLLVERIIGPNTPPDDGALLRILGSHHFDARMTMPMIRREAMLEASPMLAKLANPNDQWTQSVRSNLQQADAAMSDAFEHSMSLKCPHPFSDDTRDDPVENFAGGVLRKSELVDGVHLKYYQFARFIDRHPESFADYDLLSLDARRGHRKREARRGRRGAGARQTPVARFWQWPEPTPICWTSHEPSGSIDTVGLET